MEIIVSIGLFIIAVISFFYLPGKFVNNLLKIKLLFLEDLVISTILGMLLFTLVSLLFSFLKIDILTILLFVTIDILVIKQKFWTKFKFNRGDIVPCLIILVLSLIFSVTTVTSGYTGDSLRLIGVNGHDALWYLSLVNELRANFPPEHPGFVGEPLRGYHFLLFFVMAKIGNIFNLSTITLMFKLFPVLTAVLWGAGVYVLMYEWSKNRITAIFAVFFTMFGGSFVFLSWLEGHKSLSLDSGYGILQPVTSLVNPTFAISIVFLIAFLFSVHKYIKTKVVGWLFLITLIAGLTPLFKVYGGIIILGGYILLVLYEMLRRKFYILLSVLGVAVLFFTIYWQFTEKGAHLIFHPFWAPHNVLRDNFPWYGYDEKIYTYSRQGVIRGLVKTELYAFYIFLIGNMGSRVVGLVLGIVKMIKDRKKPSVFSLLVFSMALASIIIPLLFIQTGKVFETIQFAWYFLFFMGLFSAFGFGFLFSLKYNFILKILLAIIIISITLPSSIEGLAQYATLSGPLVGKQFYDSMHFLSQKGGYKDTVLSLPPEYVNLDENDLFRDFRSDKPRIPALANKRSFLSYEYFTFKDLNIDERIAFISSILKLEKSVKNNEFESIERLKPAIGRGINDYGIVYIYSPYPPKFVELFDNIEKVYSNTEAYIYEIK
jgi:hypothetical protein